MRVKERLGAALAVWLATACFACRGEPFTAPTPWETGTLQRGRIQGSFNADIGSDLPGAGEFEVLSEPMGQFSRARFVDVGPAQRVLQIQILDWSEEGWTTLELNLPTVFRRDVPIPVDGNSAAGTLTEPDGSVRYLLRGTVTMERGVDIPNSPVSGSFDNIDLVIP